MTVVCIYQAKRVFCVCLALSINIVIIGINNFQHHLTFTIEVLLAPLDISLNVFPELADWLSIAKESFMFYTENSD